MIALLPTISDAPTLPDLTWDGVDDPADQLARPFRHVGIGELKIGGRSEQLKALLGSCVGIAFLWKKRGRCGLAHCLLPGTAALPWEPGARYVSQAVPALLRQMGACAADYADIEVVVAGGGSMLDVFSSHFHIGQQNADAARKHLGLYGMNVIDFRVGGRSGRTLTVDCATGDYRIDDIVVRARGARPTHA